MAPPRIPGLEGGSRGIAETLKLVFQDSQGYNTGTLSQGNDS